MPGDTDVLFREVQSFLPLDPLWSWVLVGLCAAIPIALLLGLLIARLHYGKGWPKRQALPIAALLTAVFFIFLTPILALLILPSLTIEVHPTEITAQLWPFELEPHRIQIGEIREQAVRRYDPVGEFGGWGIRHGRDGSRAYNARGNMGVQLLLQDGGRMLLGSQRPQELDNAIRAARLRLGALGATPDGLPSPGTR